MIIEARQLYAWLLLLPMLALPAGAQQLSGGAGTSGLPQSLDQLLQSGNQSPFTGSVPAAPLQPGVLDLTVQDAIDRGLRHNLGIILSTQNSNEARAAHLKELSNLLPQINGNLRESYNKLNLKALGFSGQFQGITISPSVSVSNSDARISMTENVIDFHYFGTTRAASASARAEAFTLDSARETVTLAVAASYLLVLSAESQVQAITAELRTAEALQQLAEDREAAGLSPNIDTLRARVELQTRRQSLIEASTNLAKQRITLLRVVGLPLQQQFRLVTHIPYRPLPPVEEAGLLQRALASRPDYLAAEQQVKAAELRRKAAQAERLPSLGFSGDYGVLGTEPGNGFPTWTVNAGLKIPIFQGGKVEADIRQAEADVQRRTAARDDLKGRIEQDIADAMLDVASAADQLELARTTLDYARQALTQSQDRFSAGVANNIEVIQAQESFSTADQQYIASLYSHNIAKVLLARALGSAEKSVREALAEEAAVDNSGGSAPGGAAPVPAEPANPAAPKQIR